MKIETTATKGNIWKPKVVFSSKDVKDVEDSQRIGKQLGKSPEKGQLESLTDDLKEKLKSIRYLENTHGVICNAGFDIRILWIEWAGYKLQLKRDYKFESSRKTYLTSMYIAWKGNGKLSASCNFAIPTTKPSKANQQDYFDRNNYSNYSKLNIALLPKQYDSWQCKVYRVRKMISEHNVSLHQIIQPFYSVNVCHYEIAYIAYGMMGLGYSFTFEQLTAFKKNIDYDTISKEKKIEKLTAKEQMIRVIIANAEMLPASYPIFDLQLNKPILPLPKSLSDFPWVVPRLCDLKTLRTTHIPLNAKGFIDQGGTTLACIGIKHGATLNFGIGTGPDLVKMQKNDPYNRVSYDMKNLRSIVHDQVITIAMQMALVIWPIFGVGKFSRQNNHIISSLAFGELRKRMTRRIAFGLAQNEPVPRMINLSEAGSTGLAKCTCNGWINVGSNKYCKCPKCGIIFDRDPGATETEEQLFTLFLFKNVGPAPKDDTTVIETQPPVKKRPGRPKRKPQAGDSNDKDSDISSLPKSKKNKKNDIPTGTVTGNSDKQQQQQLEHKEHEESLPTIPNADKQRHNKLEKYHDSKCQELHGNLDDLSVRQFDKETVVSKNEPSGIYLKKDSCQTAISLGSLHFLFNFSLFRFLLLLLHIDSLLRELLLVLWLLRLYLNNHSSASSAMLCIIPSLIEGIGLT